MATDRLVCARIAFFWWEIVAIGYKLTMFWQAFLYFEGKCLRHDYVNNCCKKKNKKLYSHRSCVLLSWLVVHDKLDILLSFT